MLRILKPFNDKSESELLEEIDDDQSSNASEELTNDDDDIISKDDNIEIISKDNDISDNEEEDISEMGIELDNEFKHLSAKELKDLCKETNLQTSGNKRKLISRLLENKNN